MADMITRCPKCGTAFRISDALLKSAKGVVRCGSCLSVFNAREHLEAGKTAPVNPSIRTARPAEAPSPKPSVPAMPVPPPERKPAPPPPSYVEKPEDDDVYTPDWRRRSGSEETVASKDRYEQELDDNDIDEDEDDEAWALELLKDDDDLNIQLKKVTPKPAEIPAAPPPVFPVEEDTLSELRPDVAETFAEIDEQLAPLAPAYHAPLEDFSKPELAEPDTRTNTEEFPTQPNPTLPEPDGASSPHKPEELDEELESPPAPPPELPKRKPIRPKLEPKSTPLKDVIASLEPEPLEVDWQEPGAWRRRLLWPLLALVALLCLLAQVAWLEFDRLSRIEPYRSAYGVACRLVGCELPELLDRSQIQTSNLLVRSHPEVVDALQVDVILQNNAPFEQTFPILELTFTNLRSEPVATRRLNPAEYLGGELLGRDKMPVRQPIHIALEIADPGKEAVSYHITIVE